MTYKNLFLAIAIFAAVDIAFFHFRIQDHQKELITISSQNITEVSPPCLRMYDAIIKYSEEYGIPQRYAFGIAFEETRYGGPFDWKYKHSQVSSVGAVGPMQIMPSTAKNIWKDSLFTDSRLRNDIDFNVKTSMAILKELYIRYGDWKIAFGYYNTGKPIVNEYAENVYNHEMKWKIK